MQLEHDHISEYVIRTQPNSKSLCTIEAIALSLSVLENNDEVAEVRIAVCGIFFMILLIPTQTVCSDSTIFL